MADAELFALIGKLRQYLMTCFASQIGFAVLIVAVLLVVRSFDKRELMQAIEENKCDCSKAGRQQPQVQNTNNINTSTPLESLYMKLSKDYENGLRTTSTGLSERSILCPNVSADSRPCTNEPAANATGSGAGSSESR